MHGNDINTENIRAQIGYYVRKGDLYHIRRSLYAKNKDYDRLEAATKIMTPAYISFETVLRQAGIVFQYYDSIFVASTHSRTIICDKQEYVFRRIKEHILTNPLGIKIQDAYSIATPERAFLDLLYLNKDYYLDNPRPLNWKLVFEILPIYANKRMSKVVEEHYTAFKQNFQETP